MRLLKILPWLFLATGCLGQPVPGALADPPPPARDGALTVWVRQQADRSARYRVSYETRHVTTLAIGLFDRGSAVPSFGFFYPGGSPVTAANPLSANAFEALRTALGTVVPAGDADKADLRRYLVKTLSNPSATPSPVQFRNFPNLSGNLRPRRYTLFAAAFDPFDQVIGFHEHDLTSQDLAAGTVAFGMSLDHGGLGAAALEGTIKGTEATPLSSLSSLIVGVFDADSTPRLGTVSDGTGRKTLDGSDPSLAPVSSFLAGQGLSDTANPDRYCFRTFPAPVTEGSRTVKAWNLPPGAQYRPFILAVRNGEDAGHFLGSPIGVSAGATASVDFGTFSTM